MKKVLYCLLLVLLIFVPIINGCGDEEGEEQKRIRMYDKNANQVIDEWEEPFSALNSIRRPGLVTYKITTLEEFLAINQFELPEGDESIDMSRVIYRLMTDIDLTSTNDFKGIDLKGATLFGNNKRIILGNMTADSFAGKDGTKTIYSLLKNTSKIYDLQISMGYYNNDALTESVIAPIYDCEYIENVHVRGAYNVKTSMKLDSSLLYAGQPCEMKDCSVLGEMVISSSAIDGPSYIGGFSGDSSTSIIENGTSKVNISVDGRSHFIIGTMVGECAGFIYKAKTEGVIGYKSNINNDKSMLGGFVGNIADSGEVKNSDSNVSIVILPKDDSDDNINYLGEVCVGGFAGSILGLCTYNIANGEIKITEMNSAYVGGFAGSTYESVIINNVTNVKISANNNNSLYISGFAANAIKGLYKGCIANSEINITAKADDNGNNPEILNVGGFYFHSDKFYKGTADNDSYVTSNSLVNKVPENSPIISNILFTNSINISYTNLSDDKSSIKYGGLWLMSYNVGIERVNIGICKDGNSKLFLNNVANTTLYSAEGFTSIVTTSNIISNYNLLNFNIYDFDVYEGEFDINKLHFSDKGNKSYLSNSREYDAGLSGKVSFTGNTQNLSELNYEVYRFINKVSKNELNYTIFNVDNLIVSTSINEDSGEEIIVYFKEEGGPLATEKINNFYQWNENGQDRFVFVQIKETDEEGETPESVTRIIESNHNSATFTPMPDNMCNLNLVEYEIINAILKMTGLGENNRTINFVTIGYKKLSDGITDDESIINVQGYFVEEDGTETSLINFSIIRQLGSQENDNSLRYILYKN